MSALTANIEIAEQDGFIVNTPVAVDIVYKGALCKFNAAGYLAPCATEAGTFFAGICQEETDNSAGSAGDLSARIRTDGTHLLTGAGLAQSDVGSLVYASDDQTITTTDSGDLQLVGRITKYVSATSVWVDIFGISLAAATFALVQGNMLVGSAGGLATALDSSAGGNIAVGNDTTMVALDASGDAKMLLGNASTITSVSMSGDATIDNAGALTIAAGAVEEAMLQVPTADSLSVQRVARCTYDFGVDGGTVGAIDLGVTIPDNAVIVRSWYEVITGMTSAGNAGTFAISVEGANDVVTAVDADTVSGRVEGIQDGTIAASIKTTGAKAITFTIAVEDLTAGKVVFFLEYVVSD